VISCDWKGFGCEFLVPWRTIFETDAYSTKVRLSYFFVRKDGNYATGFQLIRFPGIVRTNGRFRPWVFLLTTCHWWSTILFHVRRLQILQISGPVVIFHRNAARTITILIFLQNGSPDIALRDVSVPASGRSLSHRGRQPPVSSIPFGPKFLTITFVIVAFDIGIPDWITFRLIATRVSDITKKRKLL
jgi:hypothetical protein